MGRAFARFTGLTFFVMKIRLMASPRKVPRSTSNRAASPVPIMAVMLIALSEGAAVLSLELTAAKILAPAFGASLVIWTAILTVTLFALAAGYFATASTRYRAWKLENILAVLIGAAVFALLLPAISGKILALGAGLGFVSGAVFSASCILLPPLFFLGMVPPTLARLLTGEQAASSGDNAGRIFAISTVGGIIAVFTIGFWALPSFGVAGACRLVAIFAGTVPLVILLRKGKWIQGVIVAVALLISFSGTSEKETRGKKITQVFKSDGLLGQLTITDDKQLGWRKLNINGVSQSLMHLPTGRSQWKYVHRLAAYSSMKPAGSNVLIAGLGAGNLVNELVRLGFKVDVIDIDKRMEDLAKRYFGMKGENVNVIVDDARHYIRTCKKQYSIVILDLSAGELQPSNLYTVEGFADAKRTLAPDGVMFLHYPGKIDAGEYPDAIGAIGRTMEEAGFEVRMINTSPKMNELSEYIFIATTTELDLAQQSFERRDTFARPYRFPFKEDIYINPVDFSLGEVMTDDKPLMDYLHRGNVSAIRKYVLKETKEKK